MNAKLVFDFYVKYQDATVALNRFLLISLDDDVQAINPPVTVCEDTAANLGFVAGLGVHLRRTVRLHYSVEFLAAFPTLDAKKSALASFGVGILNATLPGRVEFQPPPLSDYEDPDPCP